MTHGPPPTAASSSKPSSAQSGSQPQPQPDPTSVTWNAHTGAFQYPATQVSSYGTTYLTPSMTMPMAYYPNIAGNPYASYITQPQSYRLPPSSAASPAGPIRPDNKTNVPPEAPRPVTPPPPEPETYKHWDDAVTKFLVQAKFMQTLKGFEHDMLMLNPEWEQEVIPEALKEMVSGLQAILDRVAGKKREEETMDTSPDVDIVTTDDKEPTLDERKLEYMPTVNGAKLPPHSSINKSISQFLARTRARNNASNRSEFLYSLAEKRRRLLTEGEEVQAQAAVVGSCARTDAKPVDRDKQIKYDIAKNGMGPLTKTFRQDVASAQAQEAVQMSAPQDGGEHLGSDNPAGVGVLEKKRKVEFDVEHGSVEAKGKSKGKQRTRVIGRETGNDKMPTADIAGLEDDDEIEARISATIRPGLEERLKNVEDHLAVRYVPSIPRTLLARLTHLEDHIIKLEKEYPPWAALHFNQPRRGWPAPPRATPIIVPPHQRSSVETSTAQTVLSAGATTSTSAAASPTPGEPAKAGPPIKSRKVNSSLQRAVLDRLEVQKAMEEMNSMRQE